MLNTRRARILIATNLVALVVAWVPGLVGSEYSESVRLYVHGGAAVWLFATSLYLLYLVISGSRQELAAMRHRHQRELAELAERQHPSR